MSPSPRSLRILARHPTTLVSRFIGPTSRRLLTAILALFGVILLILAGYFHMQKRAQDHMLDQVLAQNALRQANSRDTILAVNRWVYRNQGFRKNRNYFLVRKLGPTPLDVLREGGDCADKSRLVSHLLDRSGVDSTLVMLFGCATCRATHTVVEARYEKGWMVVDPVFDLDFPNSAVPGAYHGVRELRRDPTILPGRVRELGAQRGAKDKVNFYKLETESYDHPRTINVEKNALLRSVAGFTNHLGIDLSLARRPKVTEDPIALLRLAAFAGALACLTLAALLNWHDGNRRGNIDRPAVNASAPKT